MVREGREVRSRTDYILGTDLRLFWNVSVRDPRHNSDHYMVLGYLRSAPLREHSEYLGRRKRLPLRPLTTPTRGDGIFAALRRAVPNPQDEYVRENVWISESTWILVDKRVSARQDPAKYQSLIQRLSRAIAVSLKGDMKRQSEEVGEEVGELLGSDPPLHWEAWHRMKGWYWAAVDRAPPPAQVTLERITAERVDLYRYVSPPGGNIPVSVEPLPVDDSVPTEDEIEWAVTRLCNH